MNRYQWLEVYKLYKENNGRAFYRDMEQLISHGFISCVVSGESNRTKSIYRFSDKWLQYGKPGFEITPGEMTPAMIRRAEKTNRLLYSNNKTHPFLVVSKQ